MENHLDVENRITNPTADNIENICKYYVKRQIKNLSRLKLFIFFKTYRYQNFLTIYTVFPF